MIGPHDPTDYPDAVRECWAVHQALRSLGFQPDDIYVAAGTAANLAFNPPAMFVILRTQDKEFIVTLGTFETGEAADKALDLWTEFAERSNAGEFAQDTMDDIYNTSNVMQNSVQFAVSLTAKGITLPLRTN